VPVESSTFARTDEFPRFVDDGSGLALGVIDIHSHILPGIDDGPTALEDAVAMLKIAAECGTTDIVATPHANARFTFDPELIDRKIAELQAAAGPAPRIHRGCDFHLTLENIQDALAQPAKYTINNKRYLLVEFSDAFIPDTTHEIFDRLQGAGLTPVITHPERNVLLRTRIDRLGSWVENGCLVQITAQSLLGRFGRTARRVASQLLQQNLAHFVASDAHDPKHRPPALNEAYIYVAKTWGEKCAQTVFVTAPRAAILGEPLDTDSAEQRYRKRRSFWFGT
jgi:protein-tyrosine phosphatase